MARGGGAKGSAIAMAVGAATAFLLLYAGWIKRDEPMEGLQARYMWMQVRNCMEAMRRHPAYVRQQMMRMQPAVYVDRWTKMQAADLMGKNEILAARDSGVPTCYPDVVVDKSGKLARMVADENCGWGLLD
eukprot:748255-Hanusia_phi.AAC.1